MRSNRWHDFSCAKSPVSERGRVAKPQVNASGASGSLGDTCMAQLLLGMTAVVPVVPLCQVPTRDGTTVPVHQPELGAS